MIMMGLKFRKKVPYSDVYIHGIVRDIHGKKMSKSLGNVIDPLEIMDKYGTDALRFSLAMSAAAGRDIQLSEDSFMSARNFCNKIWNASRFIFMNLNSKNMNIDYDKLDLVLAGFFDLKLKQKEISSSVGVPMDIIEEVLRRFNSSRHKRSFPPAL